MVGNLFLANQKEEIQTLLELIWQEWVYSGVPPPVLVENLSQKIPSNPLATPGSLRMAEIICKRLLF